MIFDRRLCVSGALLFFWWCFGKCGHWRWKMLGVCANAPVCCGCCVFLFRSFAIAVHSLYPGRCSIVVSVSRVLCSSSGGVLVARFWEIWSWRWKMLVVCARTSPINRTKARHMVKPESGTRVCVSIGFPEDWLAVYQEITVVQMTWIKHSV